MMSLADWSDGDAQRWNHTRGCQYGWAMCIAAIGGWGDRTGARRGGGLRGLHTR